MPIGCCAQRPLAKHLGADHVIAYNKEDFTQAVKDCDAVFDTVGGEVAKNAFKVLRRGGRAAFINGPAPTPPSADFASLKPDASRKREHLDRHCFTGDLGCGEAAADHHLCAGGCRGCASGERGAAFAREAGVQGAVKANYLGI